MCGICGIYHIDRQRTVDRGRLGRMLEVLHHRGPDDEGVHLDGNAGIGHRRLSIIDLSAAGHQPMGSEDGRYWLVLNGEIYNYRELRSELESSGYRFHSQSDTEVLLRMFQRDGAACLSKLNGMFAFAVWDGLEHRLFMARDHFGIKPLYYTWDGRTLAFASEIKALVRAGLVRPALDLSGFSDYLALQFVLDDRTLFSGVRKLLPGHALELDERGRLSIHCYWDVSFEVDTHHTETYFRERLRALLEDSIRLQLRADVPVGAHLSGGLDSSTVTRLAVTAGGHPFHTFSGAFRDGPEFDETGFARVVAQQSETVHHEVFPTEQDFVDLLPSLVYAMDEPAAGPGLFPQFAVSRLAAQNVKVVLGGQGGDEIFGGYTRYLVAYLEACIRGGIESTQEDHRYIVTFESILPNLPQLRGYEPLLRHFWKDGLFDSPDRRYYRLVDRSDTMRSLLNEETLRAAAREHDTFESFRTTFNHPDCHALINKMTRFDIKTLLPALLHVEDRTSMAVSLESRVPLLDFRIVELVASMPPMIKFKGGRSKHIFREVVRDLVPAEVYCRQDKMGFPVPLTRWCRRPPVRDFVHDTLLSRAARQRGLIRVDDLESKLSEETDYSRGLWGLLNLELWLQTFVDSPGAGSGQAEC